MAPARQRITAATARRPQTRSPFYVGFLFPFVSPWRPSARRRADWKAGEKVERTFGGDRASLLIIEGSLRSCRARRCGDPMMPRESIDFMLINALIPLDRSYTDGFMCEFGPATMERFNRSTENLKLFSTSCADAVNDAVRFYFTIFIYAFDLS